MKQLKAKTYNDDQKNRQDNKSLIRWACFETSMGTALLAASARGICFLEFGAGAGALEKRMRLALPGKVFAPFGPAERAQLKEWQDVFQNYVSGHSHSLKGLPLDMRGTDFQKTVWRALQKIPHGKTLSYAQVAQNIGRPAATRAVANACGRNRLAIVVPCHRVVRTDGGLGGFRWGVDLKRRLLALEER